MIIDRLDVLAALAQHDVRIARSGYVDSAEDAVAFAARRIAADQRLVPIRLYGAFPDVALTATPAFAQTPYPDEESIADAYRRIAPNVRAASGRVIAQTLTKPGTDITIECRTDSALGKLIAVRGAEHVVQHLVPLDDAGAQTLAANVQAHGHHGSREHVRRMLEHLLLKIAKFFDDSGAERLELDPVRLHGNTYTVLDAVLRSQRGLTVRHRETRERDRKGHYHASGRQ